MEEEVEVVKKKWERHAAFPSVKDKKKLVSQKKAGGCAKCGETRPYLMDLHHSIRETKRFGISRGVRMAVTWKVFKAELNKTVPLCRNCHAEMHYLENQYNITTATYLNKTKK